ncbi:MAG TPA: glutamine-hydrolyzing GMP synthase, partial [Bacteroidales bacterium]|nr:glutamine-hydrolyzing GMP synthase [Bacteroidales bacterium]
MKQKILILDFGSQYTQLIARRIRELNVYCEICPYHKIPPINSFVRGVVLSGSPSSVRDKHAPIPDLTGIKGKIPILGICYGAQYLAHFYGGEVLPSKHREYGRANLELHDKKSGLLEGLSDHTQVWMSHGDTIARLPEGFEVIGSTLDVKIGAYQVKGEQTFGIQFHPEVYHTSEGLKLLYNFAVNICGCRQDWTPASFIETTVREIQKRVGEEKVVLGLSGGVDSSVAAALLNKAISKNLTCIFVDNGVLRKDEFKNVLASYQHMGLNVTGVNAKKRFLDQLKGITEPEQKRKIIGKTFIEIFESAAKKIQNVKWLAQGTIYPDVIES